MKEKNIKVYFFRILDLFLITILFFCLIIVLFLFYFNYCEVNSLELKYFVISIILFLIVNIFFHIKSFILLKENYKKWIKLSIISKTISFIILLILIAFFYNFYTPPIWFGSSNETLRKPVIYLYPQKETNIKVQLNYKWKLIADYPKYDEKINWWEVKAYPDGTLINKADNKEYSYLFWEWKPSKPINWDLSKWFVIPWENTREFLQETLSKMWLTPKEYNEFIVYWYPLMKDNKYNLIHFAEEQYTNEAPLKIIPKPDSTLRVFMVFKWLDKKKEIEKQELKSFERKWFSVVEWWGTEIK